MHRKYDLRRPWFLTSLLLVILFISLSPVIGQQTIQTKNGNNMMIHIIDAYYYEADNDGYENDIQTFFEVSFCSLKNVNNVDLYVEIVLPSGTNFIYGFSVITKLKQLNFSLLLSNHAIESGWYTIKIHGVLKTGGTGYGIETFTFDPPGAGNKGGDPQATLVLLS